VSERLLSVGLDVGTTSTQMIVSELVVENQAGSFSVPEMAIAERKILYKSKHSFFIEKRNKFTFIWNFHKYSPN
jgi:ethanolamine utilization protein EutA